MNPLKLLRLVHFILSAGPEITAQIDALIAFAKDVADRYNKAEGDGASIMSVIGEDDSYFETLAANHPSVAVACESFQANEPNDGSAEASVAAARPRGIFRDLFKDVVENPEKYVKLFLTFKELFGLATPGESATTADSPTPSDQVADDVVDVSETSTDASCDEAADDAS